MITHYHPDHIGALDYFDCPIYDNNLGEKEYEIGPFKFEIIKTYGHTTDSVTYYFKNDKVMFTGDFLFEKTVGRWDFETGDYEQMKTSILKIKKYPDDITIYPGHGNTTNLGYEKINNIYFK